jgi:hypothetical protein
MTTRETRSVYVSAGAPYCLTSWLKSTGYRVVQVTATDWVYPQVSDHPDIYMCRMGVFPHAPVLFARPGDLQYTYPGNIAYNAVCLDRYLIHRLDCTAVSVRALADQMGLQAVSVRQGYTKCNTVVVDGCSVITADAGIVKTLSRSCPDVDVLKITEGYVHLAGFSTGFLGGASGRVDDTIVFCGDITTHPDCARIVQFIRARGLEVVHFPGLPLTDVGSIIEG